MSETAATTSGDDTSDVLLGLIGFASNALLALAEKKLLRWQQP